VEKLPAHKILAGNQSERTTSSRGFLSFLVYLWQFCIVLTLSGPKTFLYVFFCFLSIFDWEFFFLFCFLLILDREFSFCFLPIFDRELSFFLFCFLPIFDRELSFSLLFLKHICSFIVNGSFLGDPFVPSSEGKDGFLSWVKVYGRWVEILARKACRKAGHDVCQGIGLASGSGIRECPTSFPWHSCNNDDL